MSTPTVTPEPTGYQTIAADLRHIADLLDKAADVPTHNNPWINLDIQPGGNDEQVVDRTDRLGTALFGRPGNVLEMTGGRYHYDVRGMVGAVRVHLYDAISEATAKRHAPQAQLAAKEAELARLRAEVEKLRAANVRLDEQATGDPEGLDYSRPADSDDPQPVAGRVPPSYGAVADSSMRLVPLLKLPMRDEKPRADPHECDYPATCLRSGPHQMPEPRLPDAPFGSI